MMLPIFKRWLAELCLFYSYPGWPTDENVQAAFADAKHMDEAALEFIGGFIRREYENWPRSLSAAMAKGYREYQRMEAEKRRDEERKREEVKWQPATPEKAAQDQRRCQDILHAVRTGTRPPWYEESRDSAGYAGPDSYQRGRG